MVTVWSTAVTVTQVVPEGAPFLHTFSPTVAVPTRVNVVVSGGSALVTGLASVPMGPTLTVVPMNWPSGVCQPLAALQCPAASRRDGPSPRNVAVRPTGRMTDEGTGARRLSVDVHAPTVGRTPRTGQSSRGGMGEGNL
ncbi:hypothetical protein [Streptacidiphilus sp. PAMC 29251]